MRKSARIAVAAIALALMLPGQAHAAGCTNPTAAVGTKIYNSDYDAFEGCTATHGWVAFYPPGRPNGWPGCSLPWGGTLPSGQSVNAYQANVVISPATCTSETRTCNAGTLSGSYTYQNCTVNSDPCAATSPSPGTVCQDGTVYAGLSPDGNVKMYTTPTDGPQRHWYTLNPGVDTAVVNCSGSKTQTGCTTGKANQAILAGLGSDYEAAAYCAGLTTGGHSDWYLPALNELKVLYTNRSAIGGFGGSEYWSSSEYNTADAYELFFTFADTGTTNTKQYGSNGTPVRCVRR